MWKSLSFALLSSALVGCSGSQSGSFQSASPSPSAAAASVAPTGSFSAAPKSMAVLTTTDSAVDALAATTTPGSSGYRVGPLDILVIDVFKVQELSQTVQVSEVGTFSYPLIGDVKAAGLTVAQIEQKLQRDLGDKYLHNPQVTVLVKEYNSQRVTVDGAVKKPGVFPMRGRTTLMQALAGAEGLTPTADNTLVVFRQNGNERSVAKYAMSDLRSGAVADPQLQPGDIVMAPSSAVKENLDNLFKAAPLVRNLSLM